MVAVHDDEESIRAAADDDGEKAVDPTDVAAMVEGLPVEVDTEPHPDDGDTDRIELVRTGLVRIWIGDKRYRLRRPFFGEFKRIRLALGDAADEVADASDESLRVSREMVAARPSDDVIEAMDPDEWAKWRKDQRTRTRDVNRALGDTVDQVRLEWWESTWDLLSVDGRPDDWPSWVTDPMLANALVTHWRSSPLARG